MTRLQAIATLAYRLRRRDVAANVHEEAEAILRISERAVLLTRRLWLAAERREAAVEAAAW